jgi:two-component system chemotaxis response regulator CheB
MTHQKVIVIGASAGGFEPLLRIVSELPADLRAPLFVVVHIAPESPGYLPEILASRGSLPAKNAIDGDLMRNGHIYVAPPDRHLTIHKNGRMRTPKGPRENRSRPAVDPLFRSAALAFGSRVIGAVLSGGLDDGSAGLRGIKMCGGTTIVQDPADAIVNSMPANALRNATVDFCRPASEIAPLIVRLVEEESERIQPHLEPVMRKQLEKEVEIAENSYKAPAIKDFGLPSIFTCPDCHGALLKVRGDRPVRFRCHTGHAFTAETLLAEMGEATEQAIWGAVRSLQEEAMLLGHLADHWQEIDDATAKEYRRKAKAAMDRADEIRGATKDDIAGKIAIRSTAEKII